MYKTNDNFFVDMSDVHTIFVDIENGLFYLLPVFANLVMKMLLNGKTNDEIKEAFKDIPEIPNNYEKRVDYVIEQLLKFKLIESGENTNQDANVELSINIIQELQESDFDYKIEPSDDVQQLLLDDPIHDVSIDGWTPTKK